MATTINSYSVKLGLDASEYIRQSDLSRRETQSLIREINSARNPADNYERSIKLIDKALKSGAIDQATYNRLLESADTKLANASRSATSYASSIKGLVAGYVSFRLVKDVISDSVSLAADAEQASVAFKVMLGSAAESTKVLGELRQFAASTPFQQDEIRDAGRLLLAFGFGANEVVKQLTVLGNIASGTNQRIGELAELYGKAKVQQKIFSEDLNQFTGRGINVLDGLADRFGVVSSEVKKMASEGKIAFSDIQAVVENLAATKFGNMIAEQSRTAAGQISTLRDELNGLKKDFAETFVMPAGQAGIPFFNDMIRMLKNYDNIKQEFADISKERAEAFVGPEASDNQKWNAYYNRFDVNADKMRKDSEDWFKRKVFGSADEAFATSQGNYNLQRPDFSPKKAESTAIGQTIQAGIDSLRTGAGGMLDTIRAIQQSGSMVAMSGMANTKELATALKDDPAIENLTVGTQAAYQYLTQATRDADKEARLQEVRKRQLDENAKEQRNKMNEYLDAINVAKQNNGFKRFR